MKIRPRDYQAAAVDATFNYFPTHPKGNPVVVMPTGTGKSVVIAETCLRAIVGWPATRILCCTHVKELVGQNAAKMLDVWPGAPIGVVASGLNREEYNRPITFGSVQTLYTRVPMLGHIDLLLIDEAHMVGKKESSMYIQLINGLTAVNSRLRIIGYTATDYRMGAGRLADDGEGVFTDVCFDMSTRACFKWLFEQNYLAKLFPKRSRTATIDVKGVKTVNGEYDQKEAESRAMAITEKALIESMEIAGGRNHWLMFANGVDHAVMMAELMNAMGIETLCVHSKMKGAQRDANIAAFKAMEVQALVNNGILTTGFDDPRIDYLGIMRITKSAPLWVQILGRGSRPYYDSLYKPWFRPGEVLPVVKREDGLWHYDLNTLEGRTAAIATGPKPLGCLVGDFGANARRLGPINDPVIPVKKGKGGPGRAPVRCCPQCDVENHASVRECEFCGFEFPVHLKIDTEAATDNLIAEDEDQKEYFNVDMVTYRKHIPRREGSFSSLEVNYYSGMRVFKEYVCLSHTSAIRYRAERWWKERSNVPPPATTEAAIEGKHIDSLKTPRQILVLVNKRHPEIIGYVYEDENEQRAA